MKITIQDDDGTILYEQDDPGYIHIPMIMDGKHDIECEDDDCPDPRCVERRREAEQLIRKWCADETEIAFRYFLGQSCDIDAFEKLPNSCVASKVRVASYTRNELVFTNGDRVPFSFPHVNVYSDDQVMFTSGQWEASVSPWNEELHDIEKKNAATERRRNEVLAKVRLRSTPAINSKLH